MCRTCVGHVCVDILFAVLPCGVVVLHVYFCCEEGGRNKHCQDYHLTESPTVVIELFSSSRYNKYYLMQHINRRHFYKQHLLFSVRRDLVFAKIM